MTKRLTVIAALLLVPTFIVGVYGQNFDNMPELHWRFGYAWSWGLIVGDDDPAAALLPPARLDRRAARAGDAAAVAVARPALPRRAATPNLRSYDRRVPYFICPNCKDRSIDHDRREGLTNDAVACHRCGFGFLFELLEDYYPAPSTGFVVCDNEARVIAAGRDIFELSGYKEQDLMGRDVVEALGITGFEGDSPAQGGDRVGRAAPRASSSSCARAPARSSRSPATSSPPTTTTAACS